MSPVRRPSEQQADRKALKRSHQLLLSGPTTARIYELVEAQRRWVTWDMRPQCSALHPCALESHAKTCRQGQRQATKRLPNKRGRSSRRDSLVATATQHIHRVALIVASRKRVTRVASGIAAGPQCSFLHYGSAAIDAGGRNQQQFSPQALFKNGPQLSEPMIRMSKGGGLARSGPA
uniref:Uncharacterized protein n=1 Tax=Mycena chlorophos TaxID=658473 RepID=A0ABQ0LKV6_MYCCL|nr:predicted protein [Mycena chlorophos]